jgi:hypothetical protein
VSVFKTTFSRALNIFPSDNANIPFINTITSGITDDTNTDRLIDSTKDFFVLNVKEGDIVYNNTIGTAATVIRVSTSNTIALNADIFTDVGQEYIVYQASSQTGLSNQGCYLYIGAAADNNGVVTVTTIGGDIVTFYGIARGTVLPVQVIKLHFSGTGDVDKIVALW